MRYIQSGLGIDPYLPYKILCLYSCGPPRLRNFCMGDETMQRLALMSLLATSMICGCASVRQADLDVWVGQPMVALETHPFFLTVPVVKTQASDGTEIWNYVNGANLGSCSGGGSIYSGTVDYATYSKFSSCVQRFAACNNIFFIRDGRVTKYSQSAQVEHAAIQRSSYNRDLVGQRTSGESNGNMRSFYALYYQRRLWRKFNRLRSAQPGTQVGLR
jgi:hypothetical protein